MEFPLDAFATAVADYRQKWKAIDDCLYALCSEDLGHSDPGRTNAKMWIIGRTYATGIERKIATTGAQGSSMGQLADFIFGHRQEVDGLLAKLKEIREPLSDQKLSTIIAVHGELTALLRPILRRQQSPRSFVSKYLHFHCPGVPIYDSFAARNIKQLVRWHSGLVTFEIPAEADEEYAWYVLRFWWLYKEAVRAGAEMRVKHLDYFLLSQG